MALSERRRAAAEGVVEPSRGLTVESIDVGYAKQQVVFGASLTVAPGEVVAMFGHNGAGKTTTLRGIFGLLPLMAGTVRLGSRDVSEANSSRIFEAGVAYVPAENFVFGPLSVIENLKLGAPPRLPRDTFHERLAEVYRLFPVLEERSQQLAGTMSGGQQRMLSLGVALMSDPSLLLLDEPSLGLSPALTQRLMDTTRLLADEGEAVLLLEQNDCRAAHRGSRIADRAYIMRSGYIIHEQTRDELRDRTSYWDLF